ncbi:MAG: type II toxin-antitoxin system HigB family toxin [Bacteroidetes bacterium]|nr:type II toxin-antitoxin system HigB family toxin [Bacteroidota bacterium]
MIVTNKWILQRLRKKNIGNVKLRKAIDKLLDDLDEMTVDNPNELITKRPDADCVYGGSHYFFNINVHRTMILIEFEPDNEATILWAGSHDEYELTFKNNRNVIKKWLIDNRLIKKN